MTNAELYQMPVKAIRNILKQELQNSKDGFFNAYPSFIMSDVQKEMVYHAYEQAYSVLEKCQDYASLENYLSYMGYRMSLTDWIQSL